MHEYRTDWLLMTSPFSWFFTQQNCSFSCLFSKKYITTGISDMTALSNQCKNNSILFMKN